MSSAGSSGGQAGDEAARAGGLGVVQQVFPRESSKVIGEASQGVTSGQVSDSLIVRGTSGGQVRPHGLSFMEAKEQNFGSPASVGLWLKAAEVGRGGGGFPRQINSLEPFCAVSGTSSPRAGLLGV